MTCGMVWDHGGEGTMVWNQEPGYESSLLPHLQLSFIRGSDKSLDLFDG